jgi:hypothetical protein
LRIPSTRRVVTATTVLAIAASACTHAGHRQPGTGHHTLFGRPSSQATNTADGDVVTIDADTVQEDPDQIDVDLPGGTATARRDGVLRRGGRDITWYGRTDGSPNSNVVVTTVNGEVAAHVETDDTVVSAHTTGNGLGLRARINRGELNDATEPEVKPEAADAPAGPAPADVPVAAAADTVIDVMIVYNSAVANRYGTAMPAMAQNAVDRSNKAFTNSKIALQYRLVRAQQVADQEIAASGTSNLAGLQRSATVANLRNQYGADLVQAWGTFPSVCGQGYQQSGSGLPSQYGISVVNGANSCVNGVAPTHEWGHNLGGGHDRRTDGNRRGGDAYGTLDTTHDFLTIMAYDRRDCPGFSCTQSWLFSSPDVTFRGYPTGRGGAEDNARNIRRYGPVVANYRASKV